jgi:HlyD family secretion protein
MKIKRLFKKWWFYAAIIFVLLIGGSAFSFTRAPEVVLTTTQVEKGLFTQTVEVTGELESIDEVQLSFDISGTIQEVLVAVGDEVAEGDLLAYLNTDELLANVQNAYQAVQVANANLEQQKAGSTSETVAISQAQLLAAQATRDAAQIALTNAQVDLEKTRTLEATSTASAEASYASAISAYNNGVASYNEATDQAHEDLVSALWAGAIEVRNAVSDADEVIGARDGTGNDEYETVLSLQDAQALSEAKTAFYLAETDRDIAEDAAFALTYSSDSDAIDAAAAQVEEALESASTLLLYTRQVLEATIPAGTFSASDLSTLKNSIDATRNALQADQSAVLTAMQAVDSAMLAETGDVAALYNAMVEAQENVENVVATQASYVASAEAAVSSAEATVAMREADVMQYEASLAQATATPRTVDLAAYEAEVSRTQAAYSAALARLENAEITSPITGRVTDIALEVGEQIVAATPLVTVQTTGDQFKIVANVTESDITKIALEDSTEVTFDAFGDDVVFTGGVQGIDPAETMIEGVVYYEVTVYLNDDERLIALKPGLTADIVITTVEIADALMLPQRTVLTGEEGKYVRVKTRGSEYEERLVTTGERGNLGMILIESGVEEGEEIVVKITEE